MVGAGFAAIKPVGLAWQTGNPWASSVLAPAQGVSFLTQAGLKLRRWGRWSSPGWSSVLAWLTQGAALTQVLSLETAMGK
jgi:hypothetical protein